MAGLSTNAPGLWGGFAGLLYGSTSLSTPPGFLADATPAWVLPGAALDLYFAESLGYNSRNLATTTPDSILTYTNPSAKMVYGSDGVLRYAPHNLIRYSEQFNDALWLKTATGTGTIPVVTPNDATAPDGTQTADRVDFDRGAGNTVSDQSQISQNFTTTLSAGPTYTASFYVKAADPSSVGKILAYRTVAAAAYSTVVLTDTWQRVSLQRVAAAVTLLLEFNTRGTSGADNAFSAYLWGAQVSIGSTLFTYIPTTTAARYSLPIDHNPTTFEPLGVLIEEQRVNLLLQSQDISTTWTNNRSSESVNSIAAPDGTTTADTLIEDATTGQHWVIQTVTTTAATAYTLSAFFKAKERSVAILVLDTTFRANFDLSAGTVAFTAGSPTSTSIQSVGNDWYRCTITATVSSVSTACTLSMCDTTTGFSYAGNGTSGIYVWGAQLE